MSNKSQRLKKDREMSRKGFHRLRYDEMAEIHRLFQYSTCGYMRNPYYNHFKREVIGECYLKKEMEGTYTCRKTFPLYLKHCPVYQKWLAGRQSQLENENNNF